MGSSLKLIVECAQIRSSAILIDAFGPLNKVLHLGGCEEDDLSIGFQQPSQRVGYTLIGISVQEGWINNNQVDLTFEGSWDLTRGFFEQVKADKGVSRYLREAIIDFEQPGVLPRWLTILRQGMLESHISRGTGNEDDIAVAIGDSLSKRTGERIGKVFRIPKLRLLPVFTEQPSEFGHADLLSGRVERL